MIFRVGNMSEIRTDGAESRHEHRAGAGGREADLFGKDPVAEKVQVTDDIVLDFNGGTHGVGFMNVKAVVVKYSGDFAISCD